jgi:MFS family permease
VGEGAVLPIIPLFARERGATVAAAALVVGMRALGTMLFDVPSGLVVSRFGDKGAMVAGTALVAVGAPLSRSLVVLASLILIMGGAWAFWQVGRLTYVSEITPVGQRGRALSLAGGVSRAGTFIGPILGASSASLTAWSRRSTRRP